MFESSSKQASFKEWTRWRNRAKQKSGPAFGPLPPSPPPDAPLSLLCSFAFGDHVHSKFVCLLTRPPGPPALPPAVSPRKLNCVADLQPDVTDPTHPGLSPALNRAESERMFFLSPEMSNSRDLSPTVENPHHYHYNNPNRPRSVAGRPSPRGEQAH